MTTITIDRMQALDDAARVAARSRRRRAIDDGLYAAELVVEAIQALDAAERAEAMTAGAL